MKRTKFRVITVLLALAMLFGVLGGCQKDSERDSGNGTTIGDSKESSQQEASEEKAKQNEPTKLTIIRADGGRIVKEPNPALTELEKKTNTDLEIILVPAAEYQAKLNAMVASGDMPDIVWTSGFDVNKYVPQGVFIEISDLVEKYGTNIRNNVPESAFEKIKFEGKVYGIPVLNYAGKVGYSMRKDWLAEVKMDAPKTLDELYQVLKAFKKLKPEANPMGATAFASVVPFFNFQMLFGAYGVYPPNSKLEDGKIYTGTISQEYKEGLKYIKMLYDEKLLDPEIFIQKGDQGVQKKLNGVTGSFTDGWSSVPVILVKQNKMDPEKWVLIDPVKGPDGESGMWGLSNVSAVTSISTSCENKIEAIKFLDYLMSDEGAILSFLGIKDIHWTADGNGKPDKRTAEGQQAFDEKWLDPLSQLVQRTDIVLGFTVKADPLSSLYVDSCKNFPLYSDAFEGITTNEMQTLQADVLKFETENLIQFITGKRSIDEFDKYAAEWKDKGGEEIRQSQLKVYNKNRGTNYTFGN